MTAAGISSEIAVHHHSRFDHSPTNVEQRGLLITQNNDPNPQVQVSADHVFSRAHLGYWVFVYNANRAAAIRSIHLRIYGTLKRYGV
jgi:hypothetical protein